jgi:hypothetical protein
MKCLGAVAAVAVLCAHVSQPPQPAHAASGERTTAPADPLGPPSTAPSHELDVLHSFGSGGPWAAYLPYAPPPKPPDWIDPEAKQMALDRGG